MGRINVTSTIFAGPLGPNNNQGEQGIRAIGSQGQFTHNTSQDLSWDGLFCCTGYPCGRGNSAISDA